MKTLTTILSRLIDGGGRVIVENGQVKILSPPGLLDPSEVSILRQHKNELLRENSVSVSETQKTLGNGGVSDTAPPNFDRQGPAEVSDTAEDQAERDAIQWVETGPAAEIQEALDAAVGWFGRVGIEDQDLAPWTPPPGTEFVEPIHCDACGGLSFELWQSLAGTWRCVRHDPPHQAERLRAAAERIRRRDHRRTRRHAK